MNVPLNVNPTQTAAYTVNPLTGHKVRFARLFMTHPSPRVNRWSRIATVRRDRGLVE